MKTPITDATIHPMAAYGYKYRTVTISGWVHVDEYVAPCGTWIYIGKYMVRA